MNLLLSIISVTQIILFSNCSPRKNVEVPKVVSEKEFLEWYLLREPEKNIAKTPVQVSWDDLQRVRSVVPFGKEDSIYVGKQLKNGINDFTEAFRGKVLVSDSTIKANERDRGIAYLKISHPLFTMDGKIILIVNEYCGPLCGSGKICVFEKVKDGYKTVFEEMLWIS